MTKFEQPEDKHDYLALFDSRQAKKAYEDSLKKHPDYPPVRCVAVEPKKVDAAIAVIDQAEFTLKSAIGYTENALRTLVVTTSPLEAFVAQVFGQSQSKHGVFLCPDCLEKAILLYEEGLQVLKDMQAIVKEHAV